MDFLSMEPSPAAAKGQLHSNDSQFPEKMKLLVQVRAGIPAQSRAQMATEPTQQKHQVPSGSNRQRSQQQWVGRSSRFRGSQSLQMQGQTPPATGFPWLTSPSEPVNSGQRMRVHFVHSPSIATVTSGTYFLMC